MHPFWKAILFILAFYLSHASTASDAEVRQSYNQAITREYEQWKNKAAAYHRQDQCFGDSLAQEAYNIRQQVKLAHQEQTSWIGSMGIAVHNMVNYRSISSPTYEYFLKKGKNPEEIAYSAFKTEGATLGLENNGFGETLKIWAALKANGNIDIYPEDIDAHMLAYFKTHTADQFDKAAFDAYLKDSAKVVETSQSTNIPFNIMDLNGPPPTFWQKIDDMHLRVDHLNHQVDRLNQRIDQVEQKTTKAIATVAAMSSAILPQEGKLMINAHTGGYQNARAIAITMDHRATSHLGLHGGIAATNGGRPVARIGASFEF